MKKLSLNKKLLLAGGIVALAFACQSKPVRHSTQPAQPPQSEIDEQGEEEEETSWDYSEQFKTEEKQLKTATAPTPAEPAKVETPKAAVEAPAIPPAVPVVESKAPAAAPVVEAKTPAAPAAPVVEANRLL